MLFSDFHIPMDRNVFAKLTTNDEKEAFVYEAAQRLCEAGKFQELLDMLTTLNTQWKDLSIARLTKIIRTIFEGIKVDSHNFEQLKMLLIGLIKWSEDKKMLKLDLESKLINVYLAAGKYAECLSKITDVIKELKKYDDKSNLITMYVCESKAFYELMDFGKAKSSLTSARAMAVSSACKASLQAQIDLLSGMYLSDEKSFDTAISYFIESMEGFLQDKMESDAKIALRYIVLNKILLGKYDDIQVTLSSKLAKPLKQSQFIDILCEIANACKNRDLATYMDLIKSNSIILDTDLYARRHLLHLYSILLNNNILKVIEPYSQVRIDFIASKLQLSEELIEEKLRMMILDKKILGILDHDTQCLILYEEEEKNKDIGFKCIKMLQEFFSTAE